MSRARPAITVEVAGWDVLQLRLRRAIRDLAGEELDRVIQPHVAAIVADARRRAPRQTGELQSSIQARRLNRDRRGVLYAIGWGVRYGPWQELGLGSGAAVRGVSARIRRRRERYQAAKAAGLIRVRQGRVVNMRAQPHLGPALRARARTGRRVIIADIWRLLRRQCEAP